jgi:Leucine-rich repeat (LRR) protein
MAHQHPSPSAFAERDSEAGLVISKIGSSNNIERISGIKALPKLRILSLSRNQIKKLDGIEDAADTLEELWLSYNRIEKLSGLLRVLRRSRKAPDALVQPGAPRELSGGGSRQVLYLSNNLLSSWGEVAPLRVLSMHLSRIRGC